MKALSLTGGLDESEMVTAHRLLMMRREQERVRWLNSPNAYQKVEFLESGTDNPKKITKVSKKSLSAKVTVSRVDLVDIKVADDRYSAGRCHLHRLHILCSPFTFCLIICTRQLLHNMHERINDLFQWVQGENSTSPQPIRNGTPIKLQVEGYIAMKYELKSFYRARINSRHCRRIRVSFVTSSDKSKRRD